MLDYLKFGTYMKGRVKREKGVRLVVICGIFLAKSGKALFRKTLRSDVLRHLCFGAPQWARVVSLRGPFPYLGKSDCDNF